ncbi:tyrosine-type recombinase/integrase [Entomobacter blattae]|uniref:tyrosine-type recombinase/integrase n=1 Tax=Entomobacter blattae TaxID=2762277 RepID=UPI00193B6C7A
MTSRTSSRLHGALASVGSRLRPGKPYSNPRGTLTLRPGGRNPQSHKTACKKAGIVNFRVHDWRHHWASHLVMSGCDLHTLMKLSEWTTPRIVQRYVSVRHNPLSNALERLK